MSKLLWRDALTNMIGATARRIIGDTGGFAAVEFAMTVPIMIMMLLGCVEISDALSVDKRINIVAGSISDLVARTTPVTPRDLKDIFALGEVLIGKYSPSNLYSEVVSLEPDPATGAMKVAWSMNSRGAAPYHPGDTYPGSWDGMADAPNSLIIAKTTYVYTSAIGKFIHGPITMSHITSNVSRISAVKCPAC